MKRVYCKFGRGDCLQSAVATLFGWPKERVPPFHRWMGDLEDRYPHSSEYRHNVWVSVLKEWCPDRVLFFDRDYILKVNGGFSVAVGPTDNGESHAVVVDSETLEIVHDPNRSGTNWSGEFEYFIFFSKRSFPNG